MSGLKYVRGVSQTQEILSDRKRNRDPIFKVNRIRVVPPEWREQSLSVFVSFVKVNYSVLPL